MRVIVPVAERVEKAKDFWLIGRLPIRRFYA